MGGGVGVAELAHCRGYLSDFGWRDRVEFDQARVGGFPGGFGFDAFFLGALAFQLFL